MATVTAGSAARAGFRPSFHLVMSLVMATFVVIGFGLSYFIPMAQGTRPPDSPIVHLHGFAYFSWIALLVVQSALVNVKKVKLHRALGTFGIAVGTFTALMGLAIMFAAASITTLNEVAVRIYWLNVTAPLNFAVVFAMGIAVARTRPQVHRNLMLIATIGVLMPAINRVYMQGLGVEGVPFIATYLTMDVLLAATLWHERKTLGSISRWSLIAAAIVVGLQALNFPVSSTPEWSQFVYWLGTFVEYH